MYHVAEIVRDAQRDMHERFDSRGPGGLGTWAASYTPFPFLYALSGQIVHSMQRRAPDIVKSVVVRARDSMAESVTSSHRRVLYWRLTCTRTGQHVFYTLKDTVEHAPLPGVVAPLRGYVAVPLFQAVEGFAQFVTSEELPELYFVAKSSMRQHLLLRHLVLPPLGAVEGIVRYVVIFPSQIVFPSREEIEMRTDLFLRVSTTRVQHLVESMYSATEVLDQHWSMVQWNILGRGPYESLSPDRRADVIQSILLRIRTIASKYKLYEFMATIKLQNEMLYSDVLAACAPDEFSGVPLTQQQIDANETLVKNLAIQDEDAFPCWFYRKIETAANSQDALSTSPLSPRRRNSNSSGASPSSSKWIEFPPHENRRLERHYRFYYKQKALGRSPLPSSIVLVDEGRHEVCMETMAMTPVYWPALETQVVCRSRWLYAQRNYGLAPYPPSAARVLEQTFTYYLAFHDHEKELLEAQRAASSSWRAASSYNSTCSLSVPVEGHVVELKGPNDMMQYKRLLAGTTPFTSKRRVYRGDPRITADAKLLATWHRAMKANEQKQRAGQPPKIIPNEDDDDIEQEVEHLVLIVHGIGEALKTIDLINVVTLRSIIDCATSLRHLHREASGSTHFADNVAEEANAAASSTGSRRQPRVEFLPIEWHSKLHLEELDERIRNVTLPAIPKLREFANETVLDVLFFMSPKFHHVILEQVALEMNRVVALFQTRHSSWAKRKKVSIIAHSLGAIISFDILSHQVRPSAVSEAMKQRSWSESAYTSQKQQQAHTKAPRRHKHRGKASNVPSSLTLPEDLRLPPSLTFSVENLFCFGSPVGLFLRVRGQQLDASFSLPTCRRVFNIYHPYDPVAYRIEPILNPQRAHSKAAIIRTFEGKLRFQYQVRDAFRVMWQRLRNWRREFEFQVERDVRRFGLVESPTTPPQPASWPTSFTADREADNDGNASDASDYANGSVTLTDLGSTEAPATPVVIQATQEPESHEERNDDGSVRDESVYGRLCQGLPIDYTLQENEIEVTNEYLFALTAHVIYWTNRDASLFVAQQLLLTPAQPDDFDDDAKAQQNGQASEWNATNGAHIDVGTSRTRSVADDAMSSSRMFVEAGGTSR